MSKKEGSSVSEVIYASSCSVRLYCVPDLPPLTLTMGMPWADATNGKAITAMARMRLAQTTGLRNMLNSAWRVGVQGMI